MSSTHEMSLSDAEMEAVIVQIEAISSKEKVPAKTVFRAIMAHINKPEETSLLMRLIRHWLSEIQSTENVIKINASEMTIPQLTKIFDLNYNEENEWGLVEESLITPPLALERNLRDLRYALYNSQSEATCRIAVDIMLIQCRKYLRKKYEQAETDANVPLAETSANVPLAETSANVPLAETSANVPLAETSANVPSTPARAVVNTVNMDSIRRVKLFPEATLSTEMPNKSVPNGKFLVSGRADWALGYDTTRDEGTLLVAMEAKQRSEFSKGEAQLISYLAILRENRLRAKKTNITTQGFYTDGSRFAFICITADGEIQRSRTYDIEFQEKSGLKTVFSFIVTMMETAMKSTPNATPTKPGEQQEKEVNHFKDEVWSKVFWEGIVCLDDDMEDVIELTDPFQS